MRSTDTSLIHFDGNTLFRVGVGESFTVPDSTTVDSPTDAKFDTVRNVMGGQLIAAYTDAAGPGTNDDINANIRVEPGDVVAVGAVVGGKATVTINGVRFIDITCTAVGGVIGVIG